jgi:hypothetical protein
VTTSQTAIRVLARGEYVLSVRVAGSDYDGVGATITGGADRASRRELAFETRQPPPQTYANLLTGEADSYQWVSTIPVALEAGEYLLDIRAKGNAPALDAALLHGAGAYGLREALAGESTEAQPGFSKESATSYRVALPQDARGFVVFRDAFHEGWQASVDGQTLQHYVADGLFNAYALPGGKAGPAEAALEFAPQRSFAVGMMVSLASLLALAIAAAIGVVARNLRRGVGTGSRVVF